MFNQFDQPYRNHSAYGVSNMTSALIHRLEMLEQPVGLLMTQSNLPQDFHQWSQSQETTPKPSYFYPDDGFDADAFKKQIEPLVSGEGFPSIQFPILKTKHRVSNTIIYMVYYGNDSVHITDSGRIYTSIRNATEIPVTKSNYKNLELHPLFLGVFDKLIDLEKTPGQSNGNDNDNDNVIDKTALLESILRLTEHKVASLSTITALYACYRWYDCFERNAPLAVSFKDELIKNHTALRKIKERSPYITQAFKNLEEAFSSLLHHDGSVDFIGSSYPIQSAIHTTVDVLKSLISEEDE